MRTPFTLDELLKTLWDDYQQINPQVTRIHQLFQSQGLTVLNDHLALRTFQGDHVGLEAMASVFTALGYQEKETYDFPIKQLRAKHYEREETGESPDQAPKIFISELLTENFSEEFQTIVGSLIEQVPSVFLEPFDLGGLTQNGRPWKVSYADYERLLKESEYGAWMSAFGFRANHFTVNVNALQGWEDLVKVNHLLRENEFQLNESGGEIKGGPDELLEQSSTLAASVEVSFSDRPKAVSIPGCYYEFAKRYPLPSGKLFTGFIAQSADRIFESTDR